MSYEKMSIVEVMKKIDNNEVYLPAIQRKFVWNPDQIEKLFDSIMRNYPIGTFLFWFVEKPFTQDYVFYKFLQNYHERDRYLNEKAPDPELKEKIIGVLDGQQRLSSLYIALRGSYAVKKKYLSWNNDNAFPKRRLYVNLLNEQVQEEDEEEDYRFRFLTETQAEVIGARDYWLDVREVLQWPSDPPIDDFFDKTLDEISDDEVKNAFYRDRNKIKNLLRILHSRLVNEELINYFKVEKAGLDNILKIFVRVNSGGTVLSKTDLLFSTIVANWEKGREEIEEFIVELNNKGEGFYFNNDFVMRSCLVLTDSPVVFKVESFKTENVKAIRKAWNDIKKALLNTAKLLGEYGIHGSTLLSQNSVIPIAYYSYKGGVLDEKSKKQIRKYLMHSLLKNIFSGQGDTVLAALRNQLRTYSEFEGVYVLKNHNFSFDEIRKTKLTAQKSFEIDEQDIEEMLEYKKGTDSFLVFTVLYPHLKYDQVVFHQDHIHPTSAFTTKKLSEIGLSNEEIEDWVDKKDRLPNLQLMQGRENDVKNDRLFEEWIQDFNEEEQQKYLEANFIPEDTNYSLRNFIEFYNRRKNILREELKKRFEI